jgi:hypothetical protein
MIYSVDGSKRHPVKFHAYMSHLGRKGVKGMRNQCRELHHEYASADVTGMVLIR